MTSVTRSRAPARGLCPAEENVLKEPAPRGYRPRALYPRRPHLKHQALSTFHPENELRLLHPEVSSSTHASPVKPTQESLYSLLHRGNQRHGRLPAAHP